MSLHDDARTVLSGWTPPSARDRELRDRFVAHLDARPDGMERGCLPDHLTAGTIVLAPDASAVLLNHHRKAGGWFAFGGHCEPDDTTLAGAALREGVEESGIDGLRIDPTPVDIDAHTVGFCDPRGMVDHLDVRYAALAPAEAEWLHLLVGDWQLLSDLSFADLVLWVPSGPEGWLAVAHVRPTTGQMVFFEDIVGRRSHRGRGLVQRGVLHAGAGWPGRGGRHVRGGGLLLG